ncbi:MAG: VacJ family lipoprotein [Thermomonas sp.]
MLAPLLLLALSGCAGQAVHADAPPASAQAQAPTTPDQAASAATPPAGEPGITAADAASAPATDASAAPATADQPPLSGAALAASDAAADAANADYAAIYGSVGVDGSSDTTPVLDPWEPMNRRVHAFNLAVDSAVMRPVARAYATVVPAPVRAGVGNFFDNLGAPIAFANLLLQGRPGEALETLGRFLVNTTVGIGGLFDPAGKALKMHRHSADFGRTFARWGWRESRYLELPFLGPSTLRDAFGKVGDYELSPLTHIEKDRTRISLRALQAVDLRAGLLSLDALRQSAPDDYVLTRDAWLARRRYLIESDRKHGDEGIDALPPYLMDAPVEPEKPEAARQP